MKTPEDLKQRSSGWAQKLILLLEAETGYFYEAGDTAMLADFIAQIQRETAEECAGIVEDTDVISMRSYERPDDGRGTLCAARDEIRQKFGIKKGAV